MFILKNIALFLAGVSLIIWGFWTNTVREGEVAAEKEGDMIPENGQIQKETVPASLPPPANTRSPKKATVAKKRRGGKTVLEKKTPEKATGSQ